MRSTDYRRPARARWSFVAATVVGLLALATTTACHQRHQTFPNSLPGSGTDVSSAQAFQHFGVALPSSAIELRYEAHSGDDGGSPGTNHYILGAIFAVDCRNVPEFVVGSSLHPVTADQLPNADLDSFATRRGWTASPGVDDSWYKRDFTEFQTIEVLVERATGQCTVYLTA